MASILNSVRLMLRPLARKINLLVSRGVIGRVNDSKKCQELQVSLLADEVADEVERFQDYGFTSVPFNGAEALFVAVGANRAHGIVVSSNDRRHRPLDLNEGDVCLHTDAGPRVYLNRDDDVVHLGAKSADEFAAQAAKTKTEIDNLRTTVDNLVTDINILKIVFSTGWVVVPTDGGAALKVAAATWYGSSLSSPAIVQDVAATKVKVT